MKRQVGQGRKRRTRDESRAPLAQLSKLTPRAREEAKRQHYPAHAPHDPTLERELAGALAGYKHVGPPPDPADFYDVTLSRIARAFVDHRARIRYVTHTHLERDGGFVFANIYDGLEEVLTELGDPRPRLNAFYAGILGSEAPGTDPGDTRRLAELAHARRRLIELEVERAELERLGRRQ